MNDTPLAELHIELQLLAPTCISQRPTAPGQPAETLGYLSGTVLRGGIAARWLAGRSYAELADGERQIFQRLFLGRITFRNGWPWSDDGDTRIVPQTAWMQKRFGGWFGDYGAVGGVRDVLALLLESDAARLAEELDGWDRVESEFALERRGRWTGLEVRRRLISRTALAEPAAIGAPARGVAADSLLYSFEALEAGQRFGTVISGPPDALAALRERAGIERGTELAIGQGRSRGMGRALVRNVVETYPEPPDPEQLAEQARAFSRRAGASGGRIYLPVTLESDVLLRDKYLLSCASGDLAETLLPDVPAGMRLVRAIQRSGWISGWDQIRRLPRAPQLAVRQGSVWVYEVSEPDLRTTIEWWLAAEGTGLGERRTEGYGRVRLLHPLHAEDRERW